MEAPFDGLLYKLISHDDFRLFHVTYIIYTFTVFNEQLDRCSNVLKNIDMKYVTTFENAHA